MKRPSIFRHLRDILILPFTVTVVVPWLIKPEPLEALQAFRIIFQIAGILIGAAGLALFIYTVFLFDTLGRGTLAPWSPKQRLVVEGPYRYCRNPMISGVFFILVGETFFFQSTHLLGWALLFLVINTTYFILKEEPDLEKHFGDDYRKYCRHVPRWIPMRRPYSNLPD